MLLNVLRFLPLSRYVGICIPSTAVPISVGTVMALAGVVTFIAGVVMLVQAKMAWKRSSQPPSPGTDHSEMVDKGMKRSPVAAELYNKVDKQDTQMDGRTKHYQELDPAKMERREYASIKY